MKEILRDLEPAAEDLTYQNEPEEAVEQELSRRENYKKKGFEPETLPPPFPPPPMEPDRREEEYASDSNSEAGESEVHDSEGPAGAAMWHQEKIHGMDRLKIWWERILRWRAHYMEV